jgi:hypothetical protein
MFLPFSSADEKLNEFNWKWVSLHFEGEEQLGYPNNPKGLDPPQLHPHPLED